MKSKTETTEAKFIAGLRLYRAMLPIGNKLETTDKRAYAAHERKELALWGRLTAIASTARFTSFPGILAKLDLVATSIGAGAAEWHEGAVKSAVADLMRLSSGNDAKLLKLWEEIKADSAAFNANAPKDSKEFDRIGNAIIRKEKRLSRMTPTTPAGALVMLRFLSSLEWADNGSDDQPAASNFNHVNSPAVWAALTSYLSERAIQPAKRSSNQPAPRRKAA